VTAKRKARPVLWVSRGLSLAIAIGYLVAFTIDQQTVNGWTLLMAGSLLILLAFIWFPVRIGNASDYRVNRQHVDQPSPPLLIAAAGWFFLVGLPAIIWWNWNR
jgi:hypothetical protein